MRHPTCVRVHWHGHMSDTWALWVSMLLTPNTATNTRDMPHSHGPVSEDTWKPVGQYVDFSSYHSDIASYMLFKETNQVESLPVHLNLLLDSMYRAWNVEGLETLNTGTSNTGSQQRKNSSNGLQSIFNGYFHCRCQVKGGKWQVKSHCKRMVKWGLYAHIS